MKMEVNAFCRGLLQRARQIGLWVSLSHHYCAEIVATSEYDWALIDMEHSPNDLFSVAGQLQAFAGSGTTAIVRPPWNDSVIVKRLLDLGVPGLLFPMIQSAEEAKQAVASTRYPPQGIRGVAGSTRANKFGRVTDYIDRVEEETAVIVQLETVQALESAEEIAAVEGVSGFFFGPADIAADLGMVGKPMNQKVWDRILPVAKRLIAKGVPVGTLVLDAEFAAKLLNDGFSFVACGADTALLAKGADNLLAQVQGALNEQ